MKTLLINLEGMSRDSIKNTLYRKVTPFINSVQTELVAYNETIECSVSLVSASLYSVTAKYPNIQSESVTQVSADELVNHLISLFCAGESTEIDYIENDEKPEKKKRLIECDTPFNINSSLNEYIISQDTAKKVLSVAAHYHALRVNMADNTDVYKANVMMIGPTGTGKTALVRALAEHALHVPCCSISATTLSATGYMGGDVTDALTRLVNQTKGFTKDGKISVPLAEAGIVFIDEIDKLRFHGYANTSGIDVNGEAVQQALLSVAEGNNFDIQPEGKMSPTITINTKNILFIVGGAFVGLGNIIRERLLHTAPENLPDINEMSDDDLLRYVTDADLEAYGFIPEFIGRFPNLCVLDPLDLDDYMHILKEPKDSLVNQFTALFNECNAVPHFSDAFLSSVATLCYEKNRGARGLRCVFEDMLRNVMYVIPSCKEYSPQIDIDIDDEGTLLTYFTFTGADPSAQDMITNLIDAAFASSDTITNIEFN